MSTTLTTSPRSAWMATTAPTIDKIFRPASGKRPAQAALVDLVFINLTAVDYIELASLIESDKFEAIKMVAAAVQTADFTPVEKYLDARGITVPTPGLTPAPEEEPTVVVKRRSSKPTASTASASPGEDGPLKLTGDPEVDAFIRVKHAERMAAKAAAAPKGMSEAEVKTLISDTLASLPGAKLDKHAIASVADERINGFFATYKMPTAKVALDRVEAEATVSAILGAQLGEVFTRLATSGAGMKTEEEASTAVLSAATVPVVDPSFVVSADHKKWIEFIASQAKSKGAANLMIAGPAGCGKSEFAQHIAAVYKMPLLKMNCPNVREARDWFGYKGASNGSTYWKRSQFELAVSTGNCVIMLDEINRANTHVTNTLLPLLDDFRASFVEELGSKVKVGPNVIFIGTINIGLQYTGTFTLDKAFKDRFPVLLEMSYLQPAEEAGLLIHRVGVDKDVAKRLVDLANTIRQKASGIGGGLSHGIGTRQLLAAAEAYLAIGKPGLLCTIATHYTQEGGTDSERAAVLQMIEGKFPR